ncbi:uncharacterized protein LOC126837368 [Adelges cooleyi]|uniref:uncharacterized protein LOC126837368 n=1 Tax=Adelges cooleyi TaxID=133065 RepID=UPI00217FD29D|nr:uncharacterized protein LOC126837368 [Adelges cooleyi]XP_050427220.1 uncharacterized protein LOC126837368 [Adelges cooleyi]
MRILPYVFLLLMGMSWRCVQSTCVLETDFGLSINCGLRKSGMFRVRNLGGLKGYVGLGIQLADELGFKDSLSAVEQNKRRSVNGFPAPGSFEPLAVPSETSQTAPNQVMQNADRSAYAKMNGKNRQAIPPFRPLVSAANNMVRNVRLAQQQQQLQQQQLLQQQLQQQQLQLQQQQLQQQQPLLKPLPVPAFAALPESIAKVTVAPSTVPPPPPPPLPPQQRQPQSFSKLIPQVQQLAPLYKPFTMQGASNRRYTAFTRSPANSIESRPMPIVVVPMGGMAGAMPYTKAELPAPLSNDVDPAAMASLFNVAAANNVSADQLALALRYQQQRVAYAQVLPASTTTVSTTTTTTPMPLTTAAAPAAAAVSFDESPVTKKISMKPYKSKYSTGGQKVMNAPKEYYPVSYDKNFDDNFTSKVDLPDTSFSCGEQKHFPGLYSDEDLGCMVFHVCAFTDEGLTQKSFLCPESTLFDQTILKCNWWFYVDCKSSRKLYDSNIPISKSYQLMKALTFFSSYNTGPLTDDKHNSTSESTSGATSVSPPAPQVNITGILEDVSTSRR